jgi:hypothetical protein
MARSAIKQVQTVNEAMQAVDARKGIKPEPTLADLLGKVAGKAKAKSSGGSIGYVNWVGTITINEANLPKLTQFLDIIGGSNWHTKFIGYVAEAQQLGEPLHCENVPEAQELDIKSGKALSMKSPENPRLAHPWGAQLLGLAPYKGSRYTKLVQAGFTDGKFAALTVTK